MASPPRAPSRALAVAAVLLSLLLAGESAAGELTQEQRRGRQIYVGGTSPSGGKITAVVGEGGFEVPGSTLPCAGCHGRDGRGGSEGGVNPTDIRWSSLTKPYGSVHESGRRHPPYDEARIKRAFSLGIDPAGNELMNAMPRFRMSHQDAADLVAYLKAIDTDLDPGVTEGALRLATVLPSEGPAAEMGAAVASVLEAYFEKVNREGGICNRRIEWRSVSPSDSTGDTAVALRGLLRSGDVFAMLAVFMAGEEEEVAAVAAEEKVPVIGPFALDPPLGLPFNRYVFYLYPGLAGQARALVKFAAGEIPGDAARVAVVREEDADLAAVAEAVRREWARGGGGDVEDAVFAGDPEAARALAGELQARGVEGVFLLGSGAAARILLEEADRIGWAPRVFLPASMAGAELFRAPASFQGKLFLSVPTLPSDRTPEGLAAYREIAAGRTLPSRYRSLQLAALCSARLLVEGLKQAGRNVSREKLIESLETLYDHETGLTRPLTFGPNRRVGARGAYVVSVDQERRTFRPAGPWIDLGG